MQLQPYSQFFDLIRGNCDQILDVIVSSETQGSRLYTHTHLRGLRTSWEQVAEAERQTESRETEVVSPPPPTLESSTGSGRVEGGGLSQFDTSCPSQHRKHTTHSVVNQVAHSNRRTLTERQAGVTARVYLNICYFGCVYPLLPLALIFLLSYLARMWLRIETRLWT